MKLPITATLTIISLVASSSYVVIACHAADTGGKQPLLRTGINTGTSPTYASQVGPGTMFLETQGGSTTTESESRNLKKNAGKKVRQGNKQQGIGGGTKKNNPTNQKLNNDNANNNNNNNKDEPPSAIIFPNIFQSPDTVPPTAAPAVVPLSLPSTGPVSSPPTTIVGPSSSGEVPTTTVAPVALVSDGDNNNNNNNNPESFSDFCWKNSYGRGVGTIPDTCGSDKDKRGLLCYSKCPPGYSNPSGTVDCHQDCPGNFRDDGLFCRLAEYGRGAGYAWQFKDGFSDSGMFERCQAAQGAGNCEKWGAIVYPKCQPGYSPFGCCICRPTTPDCSALGFVGQFDLSCTKKIILGDPTLMDCPQGLEYDAGLCYTPCEPGYIGVGPVCWGQPPAGWTDCGFGAGRDLEACTSAVSEQVLSVTELVTFVATAGGSSATKISKLDAKKLKDAVKKFTEEKVEELGDLSGKLVGWMSDVDDKGGFDTMEPEDIARMVADLISFFDPTGVSSIIAAFTYPLCSKMF
jgi:hypothetical protein